MDNVHSHKINILFVIIQIDIMGGSERLVYNLAQKLDRTVFNPSIAWFHGKAKLGDFECLDIPLYCIPKTKRIDFSTMHKLGEIIKNNNIHVVNAHHFLSMVYSYYGCKMKNHIKLIYTEHSEWEIERLSLKWKIIGSYLLKHADGAVGVSSKVSEAIKKKFHVSPVELFTIQNGVDLNACSIDTDNKMAIRMELGIEDNEKVIGIVANFRKIKNHIFLLKAFNELVKIFIHVKLLLIGEGLNKCIDNTEEKIRDFVNQNGLNNKVLFLGYRSDVSDLLGIMNIFCLSSIKEGLPISLLEAMAAGLPVVGADVEGIKDVVVHKKNGLLVRLDDVSGLTSALVRLLKDCSLREKYGRESKSMVTAVYSQERCICEYQDLFLSVMGSNVKDRTEKLDSDI